MFACYQILLPGMQNSGALTVFCRKRTDNSVKAKGKAKNSLVRDWWLTACIGHTRIFFQVQSHMTQKQPSKIRPKTI